MSNDPSKDPVPAEASPADASGSDSVSPGRRVECPQCGSKLPDIPVSLCPYCASPLETAADKRRLESVNASRIARVVEHADHEAAMAWDPPESRDWYQGARLAWWSVPTAVAGAAAVSAAFALGNGGISGGASIALVVLGGLLMLAAVYLRTTGKKVQLASVERPLLKRAALIVDRRSETEISGWSGRTTYYFKIEFEDGIVGEFRFPGLGAQEDPYATNLPGVAYTRGTDLLVFRHVRV